MDRLEVEPAHGSPRRVLLLSPVRDLDPPNGDVTHTEQLVAHAPEGIEYVTYDRALRDGTLRELYRRNRTISGRFGIGGLGDLPAFAREAAVNRLRNRDLLFREPFRYFEVDDARFDLVHSHVFSLKLIASNLPLVVSNSISVDAVYRDGRGRSPRLVAAQKRADIALAASAGVTHSSYRHHGAAAIVCFSEHLKRTFAKSGTAPDRLRVVPPGIDPGSVRSSRARPDIFTVGFIGDFLAKGGPTVVAALRELGVRGVRAKLVVVGSASRLTAEASRGLDIEWLPRQERSTLLEEIIPTFSAFAYPSHFDGLPLTLLEVMAARVPVVVSDYGALPEVVEHGECGLVVPQGDPSALADALAELADQETIASVGARGRARVEAAYDARTNGRALARVYEELLVP